MQYVPHAAYYVCAHAFSCPPYVPSLVCIISAICTRISRFFISPFWLGFSIIIIIISLSLFLFFFFFKSTACYPMSFIGSSVSRRVALGTLSRRTPHSPPLPLDRFVFVLLVRYLIFYV
ncbi:hypothetical protein HGRIS_003792 [Hohenbuehelia grisea]|uniref:Uncharacterized protein n=1 Tax=Hohenbuehelia grisea TaxID=104357 RepID=A0ABR3JHE8_9AGAR